ncbi:MAG: hypothetical protein JRH16_00600 [Deltaproteobacteria bacterium]|nr:hypothetical protein [Deltaproteobacteria bacterium]
MAKSAIAILDSGSPAMRRLGTRLRQLGYGVLPCKAPDQAERLLRARGPDVASVILPVDLPTFDLSTALRFMRRLEPSGELTFVATGQRPDAEARALLRGAGIEFALWEPADDHTLRFQINRALASSRIVLGDRSLLRAPADWPIAIYAGTRRKPARVYSLSAGGCYLATWRPNIAGARVVMDLPMADGPVRVGAQVVMANVPGDFMRQNLPVGMGMCFRNLPHEIETALSAWADQRQEALGF